MSDIALSLLAHTNVGKTALARTLLGTDVGEVRDAPHVTEFAERHELLATAAGDRLLLWDTPGFGDSVRLVRRMRQRSQPLGWLLGELWDRWRDQAFWATQQALRHVREDSDVLLYLVNAAEPAAGYLAAEMELLAWIGKPVIVLLNQLGAPQSAELEATELAAWRERYAHGPAGAWVRDVLPLDAFARCWVQERTLLDAVARALDGERAAAMVRLAASWSAAREATFTEATRELAASLGRIAATRIALDGEAARSGWGERLRQFGARVLRDDGHDAAAAGERVLQRALEQEVRTDTQALLALHHIGGRADGDPLAQVLARVAGQEQQHRRVPEGRAAVLGGALTGALTGLKADLATGGLTLGAGLLAGGILGALGAAGLARGLNLVRGSDRSWVGWADEAMAAIVEAALLRYLAVAHFGRGRGNWAAGEAPAHWPAAVQQALAPHADALQALWHGRSRRYDAPEEAERLAAALQPIVDAALRAALAQLYPGSDNRRA
ncbi:MAG TPA: GTPase domain-containing protein [Rubrivivax sp.]|nr:GTPase domain-containing protein [Rubrivivax sp.]